jgi:vacuolar protein sorting-associated protein 13A/C
VTTDVSEYRSPPINIEDIGSVHFRLRRLRESQEQVDLIRADVRIEGPTIFIFLSLATEGWPFVIENDSDYAVKFSQQVGLWPDILVSC